MAHFYNDLMSICLECDHCRIRHDISDLDISKSRNQETIGTKFTRIFRRDKITEVRCAKGVLTDHQGVPKVWGSLTVLRKAEERTDGYCPFYSPDEYVGEDDD